MTPPRGDVIPASGFPGLVHAVQDRIARRDDDPDLPSAPDGAPGSSRRPEIGRGVLDAVDGAWEKTRRRLLGGPPTLGDAFITVIAGVFCVPFAAQVAARTQDNGPLTVLALGVVGLFALPFLWRRTFPLQVMLAVAAAHLMQVVLLSEASSANITAPMALYAVARWSEDRRARRGALLLALVGSVVAGVDWARGVNGSGTLLDSFVLVLMITVMCLAVTVAAWLLGALVRQRAEAVAQTRERAAAVERGRVQNIRLAAQEERARIAREMHDVVAHSLSVIVVQSDGASYALDTALDSALEAAEGGDPQIMAEALRTASSVLATIGNTARESLADTRRLVAVLRQDEAGAEYAPTGGVDSLDALIEPLQAAGLPITTDVTGRRRPLSRASDLAVYRVVQEALTNVIKHAGEAQVWVSLDYLEEVLLITVRDDGPGVTTPPDGHGHGLVGMKERLGAVGGSLWAGGAPGGGFVVEARIPYDAPDRHGHGGTGAPPWTT